MPPVALSAAELVLALVRGVFVASVLSSFGASLFLLIIAPRRIEGNAAKSIAQHCHRVIWWSLLTTLVVAPFWLLLEASAIADTETAEQAILVAPSVLLDTQFGQILALQLLALVGVGLATVQDRQTGRLVTTAFALVATLLEAGHSHAFAMSHGLSALLLLQALHLVAAGAWLGGLLPLLFAVKEAPLFLATVIARGYSALGLVSVSVLVVTAVIQGWTLGGGLKSLTGTAYGALLLTKAALFAVLIALAARNRFSLTPALMHLDGERARRALVQSIARETLVGLCVVLVAGLLSSVEPGMHQHFR